VREKKVSLKKAWRLWKKICFKPDILLADSEYDILEFQRRLLEELVLPIIDTTQGTLVRVYQLPTGQSYTLFIALGG
jgi:hypothetical protein